MLVLVKVLIVVVIAVVWDKPLLLTDKSSSNTGQKWKACHKKVDKSEPKKTKWEIESI